MPARVSPKLEFKKAQEAAMRDGSGIPDDIGILPQTFIYPRGTRERWTWHLRKAWMKSRFAEVISVGYAWWTLRPRPQFDIKKVTTIATDLHKRMYEALASGKIDNADEFLCAGLHTSLKLRIRERGSNKAMSWTCTNLSKPRLCSYKMVLLPAADGTPKNERTGIFQAVVKLRSSQSLSPRQSSSVNQKDKHNTTQLQTNTKAKELCEYIVIQKFMRKGKLGNWKLWGFAQETNMVDWAIDERKMRLAMRQQAMTAAKR